MSIRLKSCIFLVLVFAIGWPILVGTWLLGRHSLAESGISMLGYAMSPGLAAILCTLALERGRRAEALGLRFRPNLWWLWAVLIPLVVVLLSIAITGLLSEYGLATIDVMAQRAAVTLAIPANHAVADVGGALALGLVQNTILFTLTEELGWRGYLYGLWRDSGFWRTSLATGLVWGVWHWPMIYLYGLNYPNAPIAGLIAFPIYTMLLACVFTAVRDRGGSVWPAGIMHGAVNTFGLLFLLALGDLGWPWGIAGIGGILALGIAAAVIAAVRQRDGAR